VASDWNRLIDRLLDVELTVHEHRLALAIARSTLGYRRRSERLGERLLRKRSGIGDGRSFQRARDGLVEAGLLRYEPGRRGPGNRSTYELLLDAELPALTRANTGASIARSGGTQLPAPARARIGTRRGKTTAGSIEQSIQASAAGAYMAAGGSLELNEWRSALARHAATLEKRGVDERVILAAARALGRTREFPGYLSQRAAELEQQGGPCGWQGLDRSRLTREQLAECDCRACAEWHAFQLEGAR
jgi:hypothetical protein